MNTFNSFLTSFLSLIVSLALLVFGIFAVFQSQKLINFYLSSISKNKSSNFYFELLKKTSEKKWFLFNLKLCGTLIILMALVFLFFTISAIISKK
jgi:hypothetical protein